MQGDEWAIDNEGRVTQDQTKQTLSINQDIPITELPLTFGKPYDLPFCWAGDNTKCDQSGLKLPLLYVRHKSGARYRSCQVPPQKVCKKYGVGAEKRCQDYCNAELPGSKTYVTKVGNWRTSDQRGCRCDDSCVYDGKCATTSHIEGASKLCMDANIYNVDTEGEDV